MVKLGDKQNSISQDRSKDFPKWEKNEGGVKKQEKQVADEGHSPENRYHRVEEIYKQKFCHTLSNLMIHFYEWKAQA